MSAKSLDTGLLVVGGVLFAGGCAWAVLQQGNISRFATPVNAPAGGAGYESVTLTALTATPGEWAAPAAQSAGEKWLFDVFTPPVIFYNRETKQFTVEPPVRETGPVVAVGTATPPFSVELAKVEQRAFRAQLVSVQGTVGVFSAVETGEIIRRGPGEFLPGLGLEVVSVEGKRERKTDARGNLVVEEVGVAVLRDVQTQVTANLRTGERLLEGAPSALIRTGGAEERRVRAGDVITLAGDVVRKEANGQESRETKEFTYKIESLSLEPAAVVVTREAFGDFAAETKTLAPTVYQPPAPTTQPGFAPPMGPNPFGPPPGFVPPTGAVPPGSFPGF